MIGFPLLAVSFIMKAVAVIFTLSAFILILVVLIQKGRGGGLSSAFGGGMAGGILGSKTGDFLTWVTIVLVGTFLILAVVMAKFYKPDVGDYGTPQPTPPEASQQKESTPPPSPLEDIETEGGDISIDVNSLGS
jgi:preprotein translocase subunit SecG